MSEAQLQNEQPLVSVVMPAYKARYLAEALGSVLKQSYRPLELVICDDSTTTEVEQVVDTFRATADFPVIYRRNETRLWETRSAARGIALASGVYVKFLHDDDMLQPACIASLVAVMVSNPGVSLASSRRRRIDEQGQPLPDITATVFPFDGDSLVDGEDLISFLADHTINFIGEPSAVMCRRSDLLVFGDALSALNGVRITWVADLALYVKLFKIGDLAMLAEPLTDFRVSREQFSQFGRDKPGVGEQGHINFRQAIRDLGWYRPAENRRQVAVAPITRLSKRIFKSVDMLEAISKAAGATGVSLDTWLGARRPTAAQMALIEQRLQAFAGGPQIMVLIADLQRDAAAVAVTLASLSEISLYRNIDVRVLSVTTAELVPAINTAAQASQAPWLLVVKAGSEFTVSGLLMVALELLEAPPLQAIYADELLRDAQGNLGIMLRPDFNLDLLLSCPASMARHWFFHRQTLLDLGGFEQEFADAYTLAHLLRVIEQYGLAGIGHVSETLLAGETPALADNPQERQLIERHLRVRGYQQPQVGSQWPGRYQIDYGHDLEPGVSIIVVVQDNLIQAQRCLETLLEHTRYPYYEILLLDHGSTDPETRHWLAALEQLGERRIQVRYFDQQLTQASLRNQAVEFAQGDFLLWLSASAGIVQADWLHQLINHGLRPEVGTVGAKLLSADGRVHQAGLILGLSGSASSPFAGSAPDSAGYMHRLQVEQNYSALSSECLLINKTVFVELGGFDENALLSRWADLDLCLRVRQAGYLNVWTPRAQLLVDSPTEVAPSRAEEDSLFERWLPVLARDPAYNQGFSLQAGEEFKLAAPQLCWRPLQSWQPLPTILAHPADLFGCGHYRVIQPFRGLKSESLVDGILSSGPLQVLELERFQPDVVVLQRQVGEARMEAMRRIKAFSKAFKVYELDDYLPNLPLKSPHRQHMPKDILKSLRGAMAYVDRLVVSTEPLAEAFRDLHSDIRVVENRLPVSWWSNLQGARRPSVRPRVGWAGGASHVGDLDLIADVVKALAGEVDWIFFGMCPEKLRPYVREFHPGVDIDLYPAKLASLNLDLALAPLEQNLFNECKSNLRLLEYGACGFPVICSDVLSYQVDLPVTRVKNRFRDWMEAIRMHIADLEATGRMGDQLQAAVRRDWMLEGHHLQRWLDAWMPD